MGAICTGSCFALIYKKKKSSLNTHENVHLSGYRKALDNTKTKQKKNIFLYSINTV